MNVYSGVAVGFGAQVPGSGAVRRCRCFLLSPVTYCPFLADKKNSYIHLFDRRLRFPTRRVRPTVTFDSVSSPPPFTCDWLTRCLRSIGLVGLNDVER